MKFTRTLILAATLIIATGAARATTSELTLAGNTSGFFDGGAAGTNVSLLGLNYNGTTFGPSTTVGGGLSLGGGGSNDLGKFTLTGTPATYTGHTFGLQVLFTVPTGISGGGGTTVSALFTGQVASLGNGFLHIDFDNTPSVFNFNDGTNSGSFSLTVNDMDINPGLTNSVSGLILANVSPIPEVSSFLPLGLVLGMVGAAEAFRRRRLAQAA